MYEYCENCSHKTVCMRYVCRLSIEDLKKWCNKKRKVKGMTLSDVASATGIPLSTINRFLATDNTEFRYSTICPIVTYFISIDECPIHSGEWTNNHKEESEGIQKTVDIQRVIIFSLIGILSILVIIIAILFIFIVRR